MTIKERLWRKKKYQESDNSSFRFLSKALDVIYTGIQEKQDTGRMPCL